MIHGLSEEVRTGWFLGGILFLLPLSAIVGYMMARRGHSATKAVSVGVIVATWGGVFDLVLTFGIPIWMALIGLTVLPALGILYALGLLAARESIQKRRKK